LSLLPPGVRHRTGLLQIELIDQIAPRDLMPLVVPTRVTLAQAIVRPAASQTRAPITKIVAHARLGHSEVNSNRP
jgi:hypothetical protein